MNSFDFLLIFFIAARCAVSSGQSDNISFSICWMSRDGVLERQNANLWLNDTALKSIRKADKVTSLTVSPGVQNKISLQYGDFIESWTLTSTPGTTLTKVRGRHKPLQQPISDIKSLHELMSPTEVFACENGTLFFFKDENFFLTFGYTSRLPVRLQSRTPSMLQVSWVENGSGAGSSHVTALYHSQLGSYSALSMETTTTNQYSFTILDPCSPYVACVEIAGAYSFTCLSAITDPDIPNDLKVTSWNSSSISLAWAPPKNNKFSLFLLTTFYLNGTDHIIEEVPVWHRGENMAFILSDIQPCNRIKFGLQTVCQTGMESHYSKMVLNNGNSLHSDVEALCQTSYDSDNYTLSWEVRNASSISKFRVYNEGVLQGTTLLTNYTVGGLLPCQQYEARVEALCGDNVVMSSKLVTAHTGFRGVSELRYRTNDSTALWESSFIDHPGIDYLYELSMVNGTVLKSSRVTETELHLPGLEESKSYILDVWEQCDGQWESKHSRLCFEGTNSSMAMLLRAAGPYPDKEMQFDISNMGLTLVVPWLLPDDVHDESSQLRASMEKIYKEKLQSLFKDFEHPIRVELATFEPAEEPDKTEILFMSFDESQYEDGPLHADQQLEYIRSLNTSNITVTDFVIHWDGPDLCASTGNPVCPNNSVCINTLDSYICVCKHGYYDVSSFIKPPASSYPVCNERGLFSQCLQKLVTGGIAKPYLTSYMGGKVKVTLNDGRCKVDEQDMFYYFQTSRKPSECGIQKQVNTTHIEFQNIMTVSLIKEKIITRRDLKIIWKCVYPRHYARNTPVSVDMKWLSTYALVEFSSSLALGLTMSLYTDNSYTESYRTAIELESEDFLFFQVTLQTNNTFASDMLLQVDSCWATESTDPEDAVKGVLLEDGCPVDETFQWQSVNGLEQRSRFSVQMFTMPQRLPFYIHCMANICGNEEDCVKYCSGLQRTERSVSQEYRTGKRAAVVSAGPVVINNRGVQLFFWAEHMMTIFIVAGSIGFLVITMLSVSATKAIITYYEQLRLK